eukprot:scaffold16432_cov69-Attheya_sp.AAC.11
MEHGAWSIEHRAWSMEHGAWSMEHGAWSMEHGAWSMEHGAWSMEQETEREDSTLGGAATILYHHGESSTKERERPILV